MIDPISYFLVLLKASLFSTNGTGNLPTLHEEMIAREWADEQNFVESLAIGQIGPGPSGLWVIALGYLTYGFTGALLASGAICIPALCILGINLVYRRVGDHPATAGFIRGVSIAIIGMSLIIMSTLLLNAGINLFNIAMVILAMILGSQPRIPIVVTLLIAGIAGMCFYGGLL